MDNRHYSLVLLVMVNLVIPVSCQFPLYPYQDTGECILSMEIPDESHQYDDFYVINFFGIDLLGDYRYYITVYPDGVLALGPSQENFVFTSDAFPLTGEGTTIIAPFMADVDLSLSGKVWLSSFYDYEDDILNLVQATFPDANARYIYCLTGVTWEDVSFSGSTTNSRNTFQAILLTTYGDFDEDDITGSSDSDDDDETDDNGVSDYETYVIFSYGQLTWSTGMNEGGDGNGLGGIPAQVGFNAGDGERYFTLPGSRTNEVLDLQMSSNIGIPGRWLFRVDGETIQGFSCRNEGRVGLAPSSGVMVGGTKVTIIGPCYNPVSEVVCRFGDVTVAGDLVDPGNPHTAVCVSPDCLQIGPVIVEVSLDGGQTYPFYGNFRYLGLSSVEPNVLRMDPNNWLPCTNAQSTYTVTWDAASLPNIDNVDIDVIGYCEPEDDSPFLTELYHAGNIVDVNTNGRVFTIDCTTLPPSPCGESDCNKIGAIRVRSSEGTIKPAIWSDFFPLKWLCGETSSCAAWLQSQAEISLNGQPCPCTLAQAQRDRGRFQPITGCSCEDDDPTQCLDRCVECFRSTLKNLPCGGQDCCYDSSGALLSDCGGLLYQAHQDGCVPFKSAGKIPWLSHLLLDVYPWFQCCRWEDEESCAAFKEIRRGPSCAGYIAPRPAACSGDPHIMTFDGNLFTFNGHGEFVMVELENGEVVMQARNLPTANQQASVIKAVGICEQNSDPLHVEVRPGGLNAWVNDGTEWELATFDNSLTQPYNGFTIIKGPNSFFKSPETLTIIYDSGLGLYFNGDTGTEGVISIISTGIRPDSSTRGLLGTWNNDKDDDFMDRDGFVYSTTSTPQELHQFGMSWVVDVSESCLYYRPSETHEGFTDLNFSPVFVPENPSITPEMIEEVCGTDPSCAFDLLTTGDPDLAATTAFSLAMAMSVSEANEEAGTPCPGLANPVNGIVVIADASVGGTATYTCNQGFSLTGNMVRVCQQGSTWSGSDPECVFLPPLSCIIQRPSVGIKEDVSVFVYGLPGLQTTPDDVKLRRALKNVNGLREPPSKERTVGQGSLCEIPLPSTQRGRRFGVFACETIENGYVTNSVKAVITSARKCLLPADGRVTKTVSLSDKVLLRVTLPNGPLSRLRWTKDGSWMPQWYRRPANTLQSATLNDEGVYEIFQRGRRNRGLQAIIILYVRACPKGFYGSNCNQPCTCQNGGLCDDATGECICPPGFTGSSCEETYTVGICSNVFGIPEAKGCRGILFCQSGKFGCICGPGYFGIDCKKECRYGTYGAGCTQTCNGHCDSRTGE